MAHAYTEDLDLDRIPPQRRRPMTTVVTLLVVAGLVWGGVVIVRDGLAAALGRPRCQATALGNSVDFSPEQMHHAATITAIAGQRHLPARAATIALATAIQESKLRNITYGDRDSLGLFQQRPSMGWGTREQILDPVHATNAFYDALVKVDGWQTMEITAIAQEVQRSGHPEAYADHEQEGRILASALSGYSPEGLGCRLPAPEGPGDPQALASGLRAETVVGGAASSLTTSGSTVTVTGLTGETGWSIGAWAVAQAESRGVVSVQVGDRRWVRARGRSAWTWQPADGAAGTVVLTVAG